MVPLSLEGIFMENWEKVHFSDANAAEIVRSELIIKIKKYGHATVLDYLDLAGFEPEKADYKDFVHGWNRIDMIHQITHIVNDDIWYINLDEPIHLDLSDIKIKDEKHVMDNKEETKMKEKEIKLGLGEVAGLLAGIAAFDLVQVSARFRKSNLLYNAGYLAYGVTVGVVTYQRAKKIVNDILKKKEEEA